MIDNIEITTGIAILIIAWICGTIYSTVRKNPAGIEAAFMITVGYGIFRIFILKH